jgi:hypothetical protein
MQNVKLSLLVVPWLVIGCGASHPPPTAQMANLQSATRSAEELGARSEPRAQLYLKLAEEQLAQARVAMNDDDNEGATRLIARAKTDAELAVALMREHAAKEALADASRQATAAQRATQTDEGLMP